MRGKYTVKGMSFHAFHGVMEVERELGQVFLVDAQLGFELTTEDVSPSAEPRVRGGDVYELTKNVIMGTKFKSHMNLALRIAKELFDRYPTVADATVTVARRQLFIAGNVEEILAEVTCNRNEFGDKG